MYMYALNMPGWHDRSHTVTHVGIMCSIIVAHTNWRTCLTRSTLVAIMWCGLMKSVILLEQYLLVNVISWWQCARNCELFVCLPRFQWNQAAMLWAAINVSSDCYETAERLVYVTSRRWERVVTGWLWRPAHLTVHGSFGFTTSRFC